MLREIVLLRGIRQGPLKVLSTSGGGQEWTAADQTPAASLSMNGHVSPLSRTQVVLQRKAEGIYVELNKFKPERTVFS